jgi:predicted DNA-binding antitoxin AbrB/MazE fold protein
MKEGRGMTKVKAVYENGVLRPTEPLDLPDGAKVEVTVAEPAPDGQELAEAEIIRRIEAAKDIHEWVEVTKLLPPDDGGYDILKALDENRRFSGERPRFSEGEGPE